MVGAARVLDTGALLNLPPNRLSGGLVANSQREEIARVNKDRALLIEGLRLHWRNPSAEALQRAKEAAQASGDISGLSSVDLDVLAIAIEHRAIVVSDDHRIQNVAESAGIPWIPVIGKGISEKWDWIRKCRGCGKTWPKMPDIISNECSDCGSEIRLVRK